MTFNQESLWGEVKPPRLSEVAKPDQCRRCLSAIWSGYCRTGFATHLRVTPVTPEEDLEFYLLRRNTYAIRRTAGGFHFQFRLPQHLLQANNHLVLAEHKCSDPLATGWPDYWPTTTYRFQPDDQEPPF